MITTFGSQPHFPDVNEFSHSLDLDFSDSAVDDHKSMFVDENTQLMMTSSNRNIFRVTRPLWWESTGDRRVTFIICLDPETDTYPEMCEIKDGSLKYACTKILSFAAASVNTHMVARNSIRLKFDQTDASLSKTFLCDWDT